MKLVMVIIALMGLGMNVTANDNVIADESETIREFISFDGVVARIASLKEGQGVYSEMVDEITRLITNWKKADVRAKALSLLKKEGFELSKDKKILIMEWGGGGVPYRALYLSESVYYIRQSDKEELQVEKQSLLPKVSKDADSIQRIIEKKEYEGDISGGGFDFQTYILTTLGSDEQDKVVVIYGAAVARIKDKKDKDDNMENTLKVYELIQSIRALCKIKAESGA